MTADETRDPLPAYDVLVGAWETEATHPAMPGVVVRGEATFEWLEGRRFLIERARSHHPDFPDSIVIIGEGDDGRLRMDYYDSRGVRRGYGVAFDGEVLRMWRDAPGFAQRFAGRLRDDAIEGLWELCCDGTTWSDDLRITYRRRR
jgi:hypothetical protein